MFAGIDDEPLKSENCSPTTICTSIAMVADGEEVEEDRRTSPRSPSKTVNGDNNNSLPNGKESKEGAVGPTLPITKAAKKVTEPFIEPKLKEMVQEEGITTADNCSDSMIVPDEQEETSTSRKDNDLAEVQQKENESLEDLNVKEMDLCKDSTPRSTNRRPIPSNTTRRKRTKGKSRSRKPQKRSYATTQSSNNHGPAISASSAATATATSCTTTGIPTASTASLIAMNVPGDRIAHDNHELIGQRTQQLSQPSLQQQHRSPFIMVKKDGSVNVVNTITAEDTNEKNTKTKNFNTNLGGRKAVRGFHSSTLSNKYDADTADSTWICVFCKRGPHKMGLGDLFGPYIASLEDTDENGTSDSYREAMHLQSQEKYYHCKRQRIEHESSANGSSNAMDRKPEVMNNERK